MGIDWGNDPAYVDRLKADPDRRARLVAGDWIPTDFTFGYLDLFGHHSMTVDYLKPGDEGYVRREYAGTDLLRGVDRSTNQQKKETLADVHRRVREVSAAHVRLAPWLKHAPHCNRANAEECDCGLNEELRSLRGDPAPVRWETP